MARFDWPEIKSPACYGGAGHHTATLMGQARIYYCGIKGGVKARKSPAEAGLVGLEQPFKSAHASVALHRQLKANAPAVQYAGILKGQATAAAHDVTADSARNLVHVSSSLLMTLYSHQQRACKRTQAHGLCAFLHIQHLRIGSGQFGQGAGPPGAIVGKDGGQHAIKGAFAMIVPCIGIRRLSRLHVIRVQGIVQ